ncbi:sulfotransferase 2B1 [Anolis carolinensis]|uniref:Sulfotransferase n=1 Tax=Anolis carolinensis TaxID=28377 RepID=H9GKI0_ANOCA|nr:PREDICTED: sulfotransferase family cytosolic 2B member 1 [Anolis carolinensis]XP_016851586.1 PREDICTED: sulfotransferase family cytosolic 2B member 1 [Anolis carolinensis]|eukprot:XP_003225132.1 PREDICTED: sulfotransferase family cytosolic 2B member 1 [Anolis carolinensis]
MSESEKKYFTHKGILFSPVGGNSVEILNYVEKEFQLFDDDVVTVTYPKSGTNWMLEILGLTQHGGDPSWVRSAPVWDRFPWIEVHDCLDKAKTSPPPRFLTSHLPFQLFPKSFIHSKAKIIYVLRNPKDVLVSSYHFSKFFKGFPDPGSMEEFLEKFLSGNVAYGSWFDHVRGWMELKDRSNFFMITYEELQQNLRGNVEKLCQILGKNLNSQQINSVVENASFQKMKDNNMSNFSQAPDFDHNKGKFMRKGISGDWKNHLTVAQNEHFDRVYQEKMQGIFSTPLWD